ncbi:hypothetical protein SH601_14265 [Gracilibacillus sp. S3-1-1]|uniref:Uncharacterized protein n=1 Tax=Gracilibacillus pellucidus TaxID=3095368 RepID=A0ACC6M8D2_9BACI|nr:hypothetical protein [Gracilibacillus sp. S3-1-1]MDX8047153.1 hypothetical protein [Gracilibacillus sp. S3-1-1]
MQEEERKLQEGERKLQEGERKLQEGERKLQEESTKLQEEEQKLQEGERKLQEEERKLQEGERKLQEESTKLQKDGHINLSDSAFRQKNKGHFIFGLNEMSFNRLMDVSIASCFPPLTYCWFKIPLSLGDKYLDRVPSI